MRGFLSVSASRSIKSLRKEEVLAVVVVVVVVAVAEEALLVLMPLLWFGASVAFLRFPVVVRLVVVLKDDRRLFGCIQ